ncbi:MAG: Ribose ABC transport system, permease protein RbsC, partial [uncultured Rubrobacteraceae bacterium]
ERPGANRFPRRHAPQAAALARRLVGRPDLRGARPRGDRLGAHKRGAGRELFLRLQPPRHARALGGAGHRRRRADSRDRGRLARPLRSLPNQRLDHRRRHRHGRAGGRDTAWCRGGTGGRGGGRSHKRAHYHQAARKRLYRHARYGAHHAGGARRQLRGCLGRGAARVRLFGVRERRAGPDQRHRAPRGRGGRVVLIALDPLRAQALCRGRRRGDGPALGGQDAPHADRGARTLRPRGGDYGPLHREPAQGRRPAGGSQRRLRPRIDRGGRRRGDGARGRQRGRDRDVRRRPDPGRPGQPFQHPRGERLPQGRAARRHHHRRRRPLRPAPPGEGV